MNRLRGLPDTVRRERWRHILGTQPPGHALHISSMRSKALSLATRRSARHERRGNTIV